MVGQPQRPQTSSLLLGGNRNRQMNLSTSSILSKQKIIEAVEKLSDKDLEKFSKILKADTAQRPPQAFNQEEEDDQQQLQEELLDRVEEMPEGDPDLAREETISRVSKAASRVSATKSELSRLSNKTYIMHLQQELDEEKQARMKLERELDELRKLSSEISSHLGLNKK